MPTHGTSHMRQTSAIDESALSLAVLATMPQAVFVVDDTPPYVVRWHNDAAAQLGVTISKASPVVVGSVLAQGIEAMHRTGQSVTLHDHVVVAQPCATVTLTPLVNFAGRCLVVAVPASAVSTDSHNGVRDALRSVGLMARMMAHEIKNPLAGIQAAGQLLAKKVSDSAGRELAELVVRETARIGRLIDRMAIFDGEGQAGNAFVPVNLHAPLEHAVSALEAAFPQVSIQRRFDPSLPDIAGDHDQLVQIFDNLCRNAVEAGASTIIVRSFYNHATAPVDSRHQRRLPVTVMIEDDGEGMDEQTMARLFEPYYTTKAQGQGLGLPIVAKLVDDHAGIITASRQQDKTVFTVALPHDRGLADKGEQ